MQPAPRVTEKDTIALFPQEWIRDPESAFLRSGYHDVPWEEPELLHDCVNNWQKQSAWYSRARKQASATVPSHNQVSAPVKSDSSQSPGVETELGSR